MEENSKNVTTECLHEFWLSNWNLVIFRSILNECVKSMHSFRSGTHFDHFGDWPRLIMHSFCVFWAKHGHLRGTQIFMDFHWAF